MSYVSNTGLQHYHEKIKTLLNGKANASHSHNYAGSSSAGGAANSVANSLSIQLNGGTATIFNGSAAKSINITPSAIGAAASSHTHNYAGSSSAGGVANSAVKLATARTISSNSNSLIAFSTSFDGSANVTSSLNPRYCTTYAGNTNNYPWHRVATYETNGNFNDAMVTFLINGGYNGAPYGIIRITSRTDSTFSSNSLTANWLIRSGYSEDSVYVCSYTSSSKVFVDVFLKCTATYNSQVLQVLTAGGRGSMSMPFTLISSKEADSTTTTDKKTSTEVYATIDAAATALRGAAYTKKVAAADGTAVSYAKSTDTANKATQDSGGQQINTTYIKSISASGTTLTITKGNNSTSTISADCMTNAEIDKLFS